MSLFPFLAVLICTMGALMPLLLAVTRQARLQALDAASQKVDQQQADTNAERDAVRWRMEQTKKSRQETESELTDASLALGHVEDHARRLRERFEQLKSSNKDLDLANSEKIRFRRVKQEEIDKVRAEITEAQRRLEETQKSADNRPRSYAVVPYEGPNQTRRRPIYLECRADSVVLQPENIVFTEADFDGPLGPGNPLAAALRAVREQLSLQGGIDPRNGTEPYPLLLVRPSGISAYYAARAAMKSWSSEFGYEMIGDDWSMQFPPADANLARAVDQAVKIARVEQERLIAAAPSQYGKRAKAGLYRVSESGEAPEGGPANGTEEKGSGFYSSRPPSGRYGQRPVGGGSGSGSGSGGFAGNGGDSQDNGNGAASGGSGYGSTPRKSGRSVAETYAGLENVVASNGSYGGGGTGTGGNANGAGPGLGNPGGQMPGSTSGTGSTPAVAGVAQPNMGQPGGSAAQTSVPRPEGYVNGRPPGDPQPVQPNQGEPGMGKPMAPLRPGEWHPREESAPPPKRDEKPEERKKNEQLRQKLKSLAEERGVDWGIRNAIEGAVPVARPIRIACYADRLMIVPEQGTGEAKTILFETYTKDSIDRFVSAVWDYMDTWGIAGKRMYWRPILHVYVDRGAEQRFEEFSSLLQGSGLTVERKQ